MFYNIHESNFVDIHRDPVRTGELLYHHGSLNSDMNVSTGNSSINNKRAHLSKSATLGPVFANAFAYNRPASTDMTFLYGGKCAQIHFLGCNPKGGIACRFLLLPFVFFMAVALLSSRCILRGCPIVTVTPMRLHELGQFQGELLTWCASFL